MPLMVLIMQVILPLALLLWLALWPAAGSLALFLQIVLIGSTLFGLFLTALWAMPPWWTPYLYLGVFALLTVIQLIQSRTGPQGLWMAGPAHTLVMLCVAVPALAGLYLGTQALLGRALPAGVDTVDIAPPFGPGHYLVAHGGSTRTVNVHLRTLDTRVARYQDWRGQSRALDIFAIRPSGLHVQGWRPADPARYQTFGTPVLAPCAGRVAYTEAGLKDMPVPQMDGDNKAGNVIALDCGDFFVILAHLRHGSLQVRPGDTVKTGDYLADMGNSGNSSEPHLHLHAQRGLPDSAPFGGEPLALTLNGTFPVRNQRIIVQRSLAPTQPAPPSVSP